MVVNVPLVPLVTMMPLEVKPVTSSLNSNVKVIGLAFVVMLFGAMTTVGGVVSKVTDPLAPVVLALPAKSCTVLAATLI